MMKPLAFIASAALTAAFGWTTIGCGGVGADASDDGGEENVAAASTGMPAGRTIGDMGTITGGSDMARSTCDNKQTPPAGHHNAGLDCTGCHNGSLTTSSPTSPQHWYAAGTLYDGASSTRTIAGATIHITDNNGKTVSLVTADNGNFFTSEPLVPPLKVRGSLCPSSVVMGQSASTGFCNSCHNSTFRIHIP